MAVLALFGISFFPLYTYSPEDRPQASLSWLLLFSLALLSLLSGLGWFFFTAATMADSPALDGETLRAVGSETRFGTVWTVHLALALLVLIAALTFWERNRQRGARLLTVLSALTLASLAGVGHTEAQQGVGFAVNTIADGAHLLAAGAWLGGLAALLGLLTLPARNDEWPDIHCLVTVLKRFSGMGYAAVATLVASGLVNSFYLAGSVSNVLTTPYGQLLLLKLAAFGAMLTLAAGNRFWLMPRLGTQMTSSRAPSKILRRLRLHVAGELLLGLGVLWIVSVLGTMQPASNGMPV